MCLSQKLSPAGDAALIEKLPRTSKELAEEWYTSEPAGDHPGVVATNPTLAVPALSAAVQVINEQARSARPPPSTG